jgi:hypothetical protein
LCQSELREIIIAHGHENVKATHETTLQITREANLSRKGDCILAVGADKAIVDLSPNFLEKLRSDEARLTILIQANGTVETVNAAGNARLILTHPTEIVVRKSGFINSRTLAIHANKSANEMSRELVTLLKNPKQEVRITLIVKT